MTNNIRHMKYWLMSGLIAILVVGSGTVANAKGLIRQMKQFDLDCKVRGRTVADPHPSDIDIWPNNVKRWHYSLRYAVDLGSMRYCDVGQCKKLGTTPIFSNGKDEIVFEKKSWLKVVLRRRDNFLFQRLVTNDSRVDVEKGYCRVKKFSGFPAVTPSVQ